MDATRRTDNSHTKTYLGTTYNGLHQKWTLRQTDQISKETNQFSHLSGAPTSDASPKHRTGPKNPVTSLGLPAQVVVSAAKK
jgi:hypothetical protein